MTTGAADEEAASPEGRVPKRPGRPPGPGVADATKERMLEAAEDVFSEKGFHGAAVDDIVRASDTSKGSFYFHFPNKQGIFTALLDHLTSRLLDRVERAIATQPDSDPISKLDAALEAALTAFAQRRRLARLLLVEAAGLGHAVDAHLIVVHERITAVIQRYLDEAVQSGQIEVQDTALAAAAWMGALNEVVLRWLYRGEPTHLQEALPALRTLLLRSVGYAGASHRNTREPPSQDGHSRPA